LKPFGGCRRFACENGGLLRGTSSADARDRALEMQRREPSFWSARSGWALTMLTFVAGSLAGCITSNEQGVTRPSPPDLVDQIREVDLSPRSPQRTGPVATSSPSEGPRAATYYGDDPSAVAGAQPSAGGPGAAL